MMEENPWTMHPLLQILLDLVFPPSASERLVRTCAPVTLLGKINIHMHGDVQVLFVYKDPLIRALIWQLKYNGNSRASMLLGQALKEQVFAKAPAPRIILPLPLSPERLRKRGFNQVVRFAKVAIVDLPQYVLEEKVLLRHHRDTPQAHLSRAERLSNMGGVFYIENPTTIAGRDVILLDDVVTTGATLAEAKRTLKEAGARSVTCIALAH